jgi:hypothetical protein
MPAFRAASNAMSSRRFQPAHIMAKGIALR